MLMLNVPMQAKRQQLPQQLQGLWKDIPAWTATLLFMFQPVAQSVSHPFTVHFERMLGRLSRPKSAQWQPAVQSHLGHACMHYCTVAASEPKD